MLKLTNWFI